MGRGPGIAAAAIVLLLGVSACGGEPPTQTAPTSEATTEPTTEAASPEPTEATTATPAEEEPAPEKVEVPAALKFTGTTLDGKAYDGAQLAGKPTALWFWAPWCPICRGEAPTVKELATQHEGAVNIVGVGGLGETEAMKEFVADEQVDAIPQLADEEGAVWKHFDVTSQSYWVLLDKDGNEVDRGKMDHDELTAAVTELAK